MNYESHTFPDGLKLVHLPSATSQVVYCGLAVAAGTRHEQAGEEGLAHFCEHLTFKGTNRRSATQIINSIEGLGGELNAYTAKEHTVYYCAVSKIHLRKALDVIFDIVFASSYPEHEVEREREVVCDEIESYEDSPSELIYDEFESILFKGHSLGNNILGTSDRVRNFTADDARRFTSRWYRPDRAVCFVSGDVEFKRLVKLLETKPYTAKGTATTVLSDDADSDGIAQKCVIAKPDAETVVRHRGTHQAHVMLGTTTFPATDARRWALVLLNNILGGPGLNSRLNLSLRERRGLVYTVESTAVSYADTGLWSIYFGCDPTDVDRCLQLTRRELDILADKPLTPQRLAAAKRQLKGQLAIGCDNREQFAQDLAKSILHHEACLLPEEVFEKIDSVTSQQIQSLARELFNPETMLTLIYK